MNIRTKALFLSLFPAFLILTAVLFLLLNDFRASLMDSTLRQAEFQLKALANSIDAKNLQAVSTSKTMALSQTSGFYGQHSQSLEMARNVLSEYSEFQGAYFAYEPEGPRVSLESNIDERCCVDGRFIPYVFRENGGLSLAPLSDMEVSLYYQGVKEQWLAGREDNAWLITEPYIYEGVPLVEQVYPIVIDGAFVGIAGIDRRLDNVLKLIEDFKPYETSKTYLVSRLGRFITTNHRTSELSMQQQSDFPKLDQLLGQGRFDNDQRVQKGKDPQSGQELYIVHWSIPTGDWDLVMTVEAGELLQPIKDSSFQSILISVILFLIVGTLASFLANHMVSRPLNHIVKSLQEVADGGGNLKQRVQVDSRDEIGQLGEAFNTFISTQADMIAQLDQASAQMDTGTNELTVGIEATSAAVSSQQSEHHQVSAAITEMSATAREVAQNVTLVANNISEVSVDIEHGRSSVEKTAQGVSSLQENLAALGGTIDDVSEAAGEIGSVLQVINGIAEQTNLLALNAAIEAARAGEQGRGFAVVADEVRTLAQRTQVSTHEIQQVIETLQKTSERAVVSMKENTSSLGGLVERANIAGDSLEKITTSVKSIEGISIQISVAAEQQSSTTEEIDRNIHRIVESASECGRLAEEAAKSVVKMKTTSSNVRSLVQNFDY